MTNEQILTCAINIGEQLLVNGAEISRVEDTISRICRAYGVRQSHIFSIASCIIVSLETADGEWITQTRRILNYGTNMYKLDRLNNLSRKICASRPAWDMVEEEFEAIVQSREYSPAVQVAVCAMVAAAFTVFFGGTLRDGLAAAFVGVLLKMTLFGLQAMKMKQIFSNIICSILSGLGCIFVCFVGLGRNLDAIMIGNIMLLIPGVLLTNSFRDFISGDMISGLLHFSEAIITAICVAGGFIIAIILTGGSL
ncbi:threonine/serine ThrE exporter family protein [Clostridium transplantifaecale]|uniref:threonine/serine ThrE exporter family protein n=1 Tax=Clostridium transplantifaecale TaxID=2479838 RepID=UPI000F63DBDE|nr:threonine/serine exporter family protein [Clostridium transplantifaecale]